jgi:aerobic-type carbon monoxide dehydrogenase small subunit (CoxS/CutS family)
MSREIKFTFNGNSMRMTIEDHWTLLHLIREELGYTGTKEGCGSGECGACTVNAGPVRSLWMVWPSIHAFIWRRK